MVVVASAVSVWLSVVRVEERAAGCALAALQADVAAERFRYEVRRASSRNAPGAGNCPLLDVSAERVCFVGPSPFDGRTILICWEITDGRLVRRTADWPADPRGPFADTKTMLEGLASTSRFVLMRGQPDILRPELRGPTGGVELVLDVQFGSGVIGRAQPVWLGR